MKLPDLILGSREHTLPSERSTGWVTSTLHLLLFRLRPLVYEASPLHVAAEPIVHR